MAQEKFNQAWEAIGPDYKIVQAYSERDLQPKLGTFIDLTTIVVVPEGNHNKRAGIIQRYHDIGFRRHDVHGHSSFTGSETIEETENLSAFSRIVSVNLYPNEESAIIKEG